MITLESILPDARMTGILEKAIKIANARILGIFSLAGSSN
jgi:hypothetical protein